MHKYNSNDGIEYESEECGENGMECESEDDGISVIVLNIICIICISVMVRLVGITPGHAKLD